MTSVEEPLLAPQEQIPNPPPKSAGGEVPAATCEAEWHPDHVINVRISIPLIFGRYYVTVVAGRERRNADRRKTERRKHPMVTLGNLLFIAVLGSVVGLAALAALNLLTRHALGQG